MKSTCLVVGTRPFILAIRRELALLRDSGRHVETAESIVSGCERLAELAAPLVVYFSLDLVGTGESGVARYRHFLRDFVARRRLDPQGVALGVVHNLRREGDSVFAGWGDVVTCYISSPLDGAEWLSQIEELERRMLSNER